MGDEGEDGGDAHQRRRAVTPGGAPDSTAED